EPRGEPRTGEDQDRRERAARGSDELAERRLEYSGARCPATRDVRVPRGEPVPHQHPTDDDDHERDAERDDDVAPERGTTQGAVREAESGEDEELWFREEQQRRK